MNTTGVSNAVSPLFDTESSQPASPAKGTDDSHTDATKAAFAATLAAMLNMPAPATALPAPKLEGMDSELEATAGEIAGRPKGSDRGDATGHAGKSSVGTTATSMVEESPKKGEAMKTAPLVSSNTLEVTVDDNFRSATGTLTTTPSLDVTDAKDMKNVKTVGTPVTPKSVPVRSTSDVTAVNSDVDALNPEFRTRLTRVVNRMRDEYGHNVEMVEGYRPQERQNHLYEQGRSRPGDVVTWTKSSKHTLGMAADLKIDGTYDNADGYKHLAQIAAQEGLRTLGSRDPGHVELPTRAGAAAWGASADSTGNSARINESVSRAVELALAQSGQSTDGDSSSTSPNIDSFNSFMSSAARSTGDSVRVLQAGQGTGSQLGGGMSQGGFGQDGFTQSGFTRQGTTSGIPQNTQDATQNILAQSTLSRTRQDKGVPSVATIAEPAQVASVAQVAQVAAVANVANIASSGHTSSGNATGSASAASGVSTAERVGKMLDVRDASQARPLSHMTLSLDNADGGTDRIRVDMRGAAVHTSISMGDHAGADKMSLRTGELQHALEQQGLESGSIRVATSSAQTGAGGNQHQGNGSSQQQDQEPNNNRGNARQDADDLHKDAQRQRARRDQQGGK